MWSENAIAHALVHQFLQRKALVVVPRCNWTGHECDLLAVMLPCLRIVDFEVKISRSDLKADAKKDKWWHHHPYVWRGEQPPPTARHWPPKVWKHYYVLPADIWSEELLTALPSANSGVLTLTPRPAMRSGVLVHCVRRAKPNPSAQPVRPQEALDLARLASLRMWDLALKRERVRVL